MENGIKTESRDQLGNYFKLQSDTVCCSAERVRIQVLLLPVLDDCIKTKQKGARTQDLDGQIYQVPFFK